jgi:hypothetical protein
MNIPVPLTKDQRQALQLVYDAYCRHGEWPDFGTLDRRVARLKRFPDLGLLVRDLPTGLLLPIWSGSIRPQADAKMKLTVHGLAECEGVREDVDLFLRALRGIAKRELAYEPQPGVPDDGGPITGQQLMRALHLPVGRRPDVERLGQFLEIEYWGWRGFSTGSWNWQFTAGPDVRRFAKVHSIEEYFAAKDAWHAESQQSKVDMTGFVSRVVRQEVSFEPPRAAYVDDATIDDLKQVVTSGGWNADKLFALLHELNDNFARGNTYACHTLLRAVLDHIPPLFGYGTFGEVANNTSWARTDKQYMKQLAEFRAQGDDVLHRQISGKGYALKMEDFPRPLLLRRLLVGCPRSTA